jgi:hypothetical protein
MNKNSHIFAGYQKIIHNSEKDEKIGSVLNNKNRAKLSTWIKIRILYLQIDIFFIISLKILPFGLVLDCVYSRK